MNKILLTHLMPDCQIFGLFSVIRKYIHYKRKIYSTVRSKPHPWKYKEIHIPCQIHPITAATSRFVRGVGRGVDNQQQIFAHQDLSSFFVLLLLMMLLPSDVVSEGALIEP